MQRTALLLSLLVLAAASSPLSAQIQLHDIEALAVASDSFQLTPSAPAATRSLLVDQTASLSFQLVAASQTLTVSLQSPGGTRYTVGSQSGSSFQSSIVLANSGSVRGADYVALLSSPQPGTWTVSVADSAPRTSPLDVVTTVFFNNALRVVLAGGGTGFPVASNARLALVAFDGTRRLTGVTISARMMPASSSAIPPVAVSFRDDGTGPDEAAGNGIFEAFVNAGQAGTYVVQADVTGNGSTGSFHRTATAELRFVPRNAQISGFTDEVFDDDFDGLIDGIGIMTRAHISVAGTYTVSVRLRGSNGHEIQRSTEESLSSGDETSEVIFAAGDVSRDLGVDGPYQVAEVRYYQLVNGDLLPADIKYDLGATEAFSLSGIQHPAVRLNGFGTASGIDNDGNRLFDFLEIDLGVSVDTAGSYAASVSLLDRGGREIGFASGTLSLDAGDNVMNIVFNGTAIGLNGVDGPYVLSNLIIFGEDKSLVVTNAFTTQPFSAGQFEGYMPGRRRIAH
ncbi:MAG: hypothetical protein JWN02_2188 [Acidobacteria bacterium]|nr:hypothetical protein [Acidobacteriota bacterium]